MAFADDANAKLDRLEAAFTEVQKDITELKALTPDTASNTKLLTRLDEMAAKYEKLGADTVAGQATPPSGDTV